MGYFDNCEPEDRFYFKGGASPFGLEGVERQLYDFDQRRHITVRTSWPENDDEFFTAALAKCMDNLLAATVLVELDKNKAPKNQTSAIGEDRTLIPFYPRAAAYPTTVPRIRRSQLLEVGRMGIQVDHAIYQPAGAKSAPRDVAFKYSFIKENVHAIWHEANCLLRIPKHPGVVHVDSLVVDRIPGEKDDRVVGFATAFVAGGTIESNLGRMFTLRHLTQLLSTIDFLNLELGIVHGDIHMRNLLLDQTTDHIQIFDFNRASRLGWEGDRNDNGQFAYDDDRNDVKHAVFAVYEIITRDTHFRDSIEAHRLRSAMVTGIKVWKPHTSVRLDADPSQYREILDKWVNERKEKDKRIKHYTQTPRALSWPSMPSYDAVWDCGAMVKKGSRLRQTVIQNGEKFLHWERPPSSKLPLPSGKKLLATGEVV